MQLPRVDHSVLRSISPRAKSDPCEVPVSGRFKYLHSWRDRSFSRLSISNKIIWGYGISLGLAVLGTTTGLLVGHYTEKHARQQQLTAQHQVRLLSRLQVLTSQFRPEREFLPAIRDESRFRKAQAEFDQRIWEIETLFTQIQATLEPTETDPLKQFLEAFDREVKSYSEHLAAILKMADPETMQAQTVDQIEQQISEFIDGPDYLKLFRYADELTRLVDQAEQHSDAANLTLANAAILKLEIIVGSMLLSIAIATLLSIYTSRAITRPIEEVTQIAHQVTAKDDFSLRAPISTQDEVGILATALNDLIRRVADYTRELREAQTQLIQTEKMSSLGQMVAGIAHEINNPVNFIYGNLNHLREYTDELLELIALYQAEYPQPSPTFQAKTGAIELEFIQTDLPKVLASMKMGTQRIREIVLSLRNFSRLDEAEMKTVDLHQGIDNTLLLLNNRIKRDISVVKQYGQLPPVECYPAQINQVFMNILNNSVDALLGSEASAQKEITIITTAQNSEVSIRFKDNGPGIPDDLIKKIFDPFFTTKPIGQGTGLGLSISYQIVQRHGGQIQVLTAPGQGAEFSIILPIKNTPEKIFTI